MSLRWMDGVAVPLRRVYSGPSRREPGMVSTKTPARRLRTIVYRAGEHPWVLMSNFGQDRYANPSGPTQWAEEFGTQWITVQSRRLHLVYDSLIATRRRGRSAPAIRPLWDPWPRHF